MATLLQVELGVLGPLQVRQYGLPVSIPGAKPRAILTLLALHGGAVVSADTLVELLWGDDPPRTAAKALQTHISSLRRTLGDGFVLTQGTGWTLNTTEIDATRYKLAAKMGRDAYASGDAGQAVACFDEALTLWRGAPELPDGPRGASEKTRWVEGHAALVEDRADALLATGRAAEIIGELEAAIADAPLRERRWSQLMLALYRAGRQGEALGAYQRARSLLAEQLGVDPGPDLRRLEAAIVAQDHGLELPVSQQLSAVMRAVTFLLTDIEGSTAAWEADADAMAVALARHDEIVEQVVTSGGGRLVKTRGEGDATFSVFDRPSAAATAAIELQEAIRHEPWALREPMRIRVALHTGEVELRDGDYFGRAVNRAARLRSLAAGGQILCSGATAELVIDSLADDIVLADLGMRQLKNLARPEHVFELRFENDDDSRAPTTDMPIQRPGVPAVLAGPGPFVGRDRELDRLLSAWQNTLAGGTSAVLIAGEPGVGKTRLAGEWSRQAYEQGAIVLYGRCDEDLGAPYQPFAEALRSLVPCLGADRLRGMRGVEALLPLAPGLTEVLPDLAAPPRADADTERYALFDAVVALLGVVSASAPVVLILDDLHWAAKPTLLLLRHLLRFGEHARVQIVGTYRGTDLDRSHPLAAMLADLHRDGSAHRLQLGGLDEDDVSAYVAEAGYDDEELGRALAAVTGGNPFFLIEALRHVDESGGHWDPSTLPQGVREAVSRRLSRLPAETNKALAAAAVVGSRFSLELVERVVGDDLVDAFDEACKAGIVIEEPGGRYRFNHALVRQSLLAELASVRRMRLHQRIAATLETEPSADDEVLAELAYHYFECAWAGNAAKAVDYCRRAADQAMARLAYEGAADLYDKALHALEELDDELSDRDDQQAELLVARCEALLAAGDVVSARGAVSQLQEAAGDSARFTAWGTCFDGQLSMLTHPERLDEIESAVSAAAEKLAELEDAAGEAKAHTVRATCLGRLGRIGDCETALDQALTAARRAGEHRRVNNVLANAPLAALWGPNPVPRAGGRCLDVVRLLRITTGSPVVEATSTRCQGVLDAFRGRAAAGRQLIESARRSLTELGMRHALLEVDQFAGIVELVADDAAAAERHLRRAYTGFRRMGLDADTAETAAFLARACLALDRDAEADELCSESERLAGHALKASIAWRTVRAQLLARGGAHDEARRMAEEAVALAERTDALVDHGDACLALAMVLHAAGDTPGARAAAQKAVELYELKGAAALAEKARTILGAEPTTAPAIDEPTQVEPENTCVRVISRLDATIGREAWLEVEQLLATVVRVESRRKIVGLPSVNLTPPEWVTEAKRFRESGMARHRRSIIAVRGERLALTQFELGGKDVHPSAPRDAMLQLFGLDENGRIAMYLWFDLEDIDAAMAELDAAHARLEERPARAPLENAASRVDHLCYALFAEGRLDEIGALLSDDHLNEDRRQGLRRASNDRATAIENIRAIAALGVKITNTPIALRGDGLCLSHILFERREVQPDAFAVETLELTEIDTDGVMVARLVFDPADIDAAFEELDARYLAGEAAPHAHTWSVIAGGYAALNRHEIPATTPDWVNIDHRRGTAFAPGDLIAFIRASWEDTPDVNVYIEAVHRLTDWGAVVVSATRGTSRQGFNAEWREIGILGFDGDRFSRCEMFDESDLDAAIGRFDELSRPMQRLINAATQVAERFRMCFATRDWDAMAALMTEDYFVDDRRRVVNAGVQRGPDLEVANMRATADIGIEDLASDIIAMRGERLVLSRTRSSGRNQPPEAFHAAVLSIVEIGADERIAARVFFDPDDIDVAFAELDARYLAGEAAAHARTWSVVAEAYAALNRRELPATTPDWVNIDHQQVTTVAPGDFIANIRASWDVAPELRIYIEAVHRLTDLGVVVTHAAQGVSQDGFDAEWRTISLYTVDGDLINRCELFAEANLDAALARFDELTRPAARLDNTASRVYERVWTHYEAREWSALAELFVDDISTDDRRRVVNAGIQHGRDVEIANIRALADLRANVDVIVLATRGQRLVLTRFWSSNADEGHGEFTAEMLTIIEIDSDDRIVAGVVFDIDDLDAAFAELDSRYLAGEAAPHARTWSVIAGAYGALNRRELAPTTPDWVNIDHRRLAANEAGDLTAYIRAAWGDTPGLSLYIEAVHRLSNVGAVFTQSARGTSHQGFDAEWRGVDILTVDGDLIDRCERFDEADIDAALARFDELSSSAPRLENAATQVVERFRKCFAVRDWDAVSDIFADAFSLDDRRRTVNAGIRHGRDAEIDDLRAAAEVGFTDVTGVVVATRGQRLALARVQWSGPDHHSEVFRNEWLGVVEIDDNERFTALVMIERDDIDAAFEELDARYLAGEAAEYAHTWAVIAAAYAAFKRHELPATAPDLMSIDHRRVAAFAPGEGVEYVRAGWDLYQDDEVYIEKVHRMSDLGAVFTWAGHGSSHEGFAAEWRGVNLMTVEGDMVSRSEVFDESDIDTALAKFDELSLPAPRLENSATRAYERFNACYLAGDWDALAETMSDDSLADDRRLFVDTGVQQGREAAVANARVTAELGVTNATSTAVATRGERLALMRARFWGNDERPDAFDTEVLHMVEIDAEHRITTFIAFDVGDIDAAVEELDARYLAGEAAPYSRTWSVIARAFVAHNRRELPATTPVGVDHRRVTAFGPGEGVEYVRAGWDLGHYIKVYIEAVRRVNDRGAVLTWAGRGRSQEGFDAEWRGVEVMAVGGDLIERVELFDETDIEAALARFDELNRSAQRLENAASQVAEQFRACFLAHNWAAMANVLADYISTDDRRRVVNAGVRHGRDALIADMQAAVEVGTQNMTLSAIATRGERLVLNRVRASNRGMPPDEFSVELLGVVEIDADSRITALDTFDVDEIDAAFEELDARYLAGEAAAHSHTWSVVMEAYAGFNRRELLATTPDWVNIDHGRGAAFAPGEFIAYIQAAWEDSPDTKIHIAAVHRLSNVGAVVTHVAHGISQEGFDAEWRDIHVLTVEGDMVSRSELFNESDLDAALARFDELSRPAPRLENAASQAYDRFNAYLTARDWDAMAAMVTDDVLDDDRRRVVSGGIRRGRDAQMANLRAIVDVGVANFESAVVATRGERLVLSRTRVSRSQRVEAFGLEMLTIIETDTTNRIAAGVNFDIDDIDAALEELDARYLVGEAAVHARTWSAVTRAYAAANRQQLMLSPDCVSVDHRRARAYAPGEITEYMKATWELAPNVRVHIETVHQLNELGAVVTHVASGASQQGFEAEWREVILVTVKGDLINRSEMFDEADLDAALARFEELSRPPRRLENAASRMEERFRACFTARDWAAMADIMAEDFLNDDRRPVVNAGARHGREAAIVHARAVADVGTENMTSAVIATRGERLALCRVRYSGHNQRPDAFHTEVLGIIEIDADGQFTAAITFDLDDIDAAFEELVARYLAGEAATHAHTWSVIAEAYAAINRHQLPATAPDLVSIDHRRVTGFAPGELLAYISAAIELSPVWGSRIEAVHRLSNRGAVVTQAARGTSQDGLDAEWREIDLLTIDGDVINRCEVFDEADIDAALARFDEIDRPAPRLENAASRVHKRFNACFAAQDFDAMAALMALDISIDDRRPLVGAGIRRGRDADIANMRAAAETGTKNVTSTVIATRGERLVLGRTRFTGRDQRPEAFHTDVLDIVELDDNARIVARVAFDVDDIDAAFEELDARYLAGDAAVHAQTWSATAAVFAGLNRHELPETTPDWIHIDHRHLATAEAGDLPAYLSAGWEVTPQASTYIEAVHRLSDFGAVFTYLAYGTSQEGFDAEWREICITTFEGHRISRGEVFDEADLDAALARFDELSRPVPRLENAASRTYERYRTYFAARDWAAMEELLTTDTCVDDHRRVVNAEPRRGRDAEIANMRAVADIGVQEITAAVIATRGERLALCRTCMSREAQHPGAFRIEFLSVVEINAEGQIVARVAFDPDKIKAAVEELDARYLAGEATDHAHAWSVIAGGYAMLNRQEIPPLSPDLINVDHRRGIAFTPGELIPYIHATWDISPDVKIHVEAVHALSNLGAVVTHLAYGTSQKGFYAEWREITILMVDHDMISRIEMFDESDIDAALARFDELNHQAPQLENAATRVYERFRASFAARDWDAIADMLAEDHISDDRRRIANEGIRHGRDAEIASMRATADFGVTFTSVAVAIRGDRLALCRTRGTTSGPDTFHLEVLRIVEIDADERMSARVSFDLDDFDAAFAELDARYLAGEAAAHARTWSVIARTYAAFNRRELPPTTPDWVNIDHRRATSFTPGDTAAYLRATWDIAPDINIYIESVHRLSDVGGVITHVAQGTSQEGFDAEWREITVFAVKGDLINRAEIFDEADLDAALARFDELSRPVPRLENAASQVYETIKAYFAARDWNAIKEILAEDVSTDDRRRVVNAGVRQGRDAAIAEVSSIAAVGVTKLSTDVIATRGEHLVLSRGRASVDDQRPEAFHTDILDIVEIDADARVVARVVLDPDDIEAAFEELDARYLAGEAAAHARTWSVVANVFAALNRREIPATTPDYVDVDHRSPAPIESADLEAYVRAAWEVAPDVRICIDAVHQLSHLGGVVTFTARGTSREGFNAEWRETMVLIVEGDLVSRCEIFDEADIDAALARFDELNAASSQLENAATRTWAGTADAFNRRDIDGSLALIAEDGRYDDRRKGLRAVHSGPARRKGMQGIFEAPKGWRWGMEPIAIRGSRLSLTRDSFRDTNDADRPITLELLTVAEVGFDDRLRDTVHFDPDDIDAAFEELETRYLAGEAGENAHTWSVVAQAFSALNRREIPDTTPDWVNVDHRRGTAFAPGDLIEFVHASWRETLDIRIFIEAVHRLSNLGAVVTHVVHGTSQEGFDAEWRVIDLMTVDGDLLSRVELFDEADFDAALARFDELNTSRPQLENAATRTWTLIVDAINRRDADGFLALASAEGRLEDRRKGLRAVHEGTERRKAAQSMCRAPDSWRMEVEPVAIRGDRLGLTRERWRDAAEAERPVTVESLTLTEVTNNELAHYTVIFDPDDINGAMAELTARWIASGDVAHPDVIMRELSLVEAANRHDWDAFTEITADATYVNHRQLAAAGVNTIAAHMSSIQTMASLVPDMRMELAEVLVHSASAAMTHQVVKGTSTDGVVMELPLFVINLHDGQHVTHMETFDFDQRAQAFARFDELSTTSPQLENAATRARVRLADALNRRDLDGIPPLAAADNRYEDRRKMLRDEGPAGPEFVRTWFDAARGTLLETVPVAIRGPRLALTRDAYRESDTNRAIALEHLTLTEVNDDGLVRNSVFFDLDDINGAFIELTNRWIASGEVDHPEIIEAHLKLLVDIANRHDWDTFATLSAGAAYVGHRQLAVGADTIADYISSIRMLASLVPDLWLEPAEILSHSALGVLTYVVVKGTSAEGAPIALPLVILVLLDGDRVSRVETFDPDERDLALARFSELNQPA